MPELVLPQLHEIIALLPPAGAAMIILGLGWVAERRFRGALYAAAALAVAVAYAWTFARVRDGALPWPPRQSSERGLYAVVAASALAIPLAWRGKATRLMPLHLVTGAAAVTLVLGGLASGVVPLATAALLAVGGWVCVRVADHASAAPAPAFGVAAALACGAAGQLFLSFGSALLGQLGGAMAITFATVALVAAFTKARIPAPPVAAVLIVLVMDAALFMYEPPPRAALGLLLAAPLSPALAQVLPARVPRFVAGLVAFAVPLVLAAAGFFIGWKAAPEPYG